MVIDWTISFGNILVAVMAVIVSVIGWFIAATLRTVNNSLQSHDKRISAIEIEQAAARGYDRGYADGKRHGGGAP